MAPKPAPEVRDPILESARAPQPIPEDPPPLVNEHNVGIYMALARSGDAIAETAEIMKRLGYG